MITATTLSFPPPPCTISATVPTSVSSIGSHTCLATHFIMHLLVVLALAVRPRPCLHGNDIPNPIGVDVFFVDLAVVQQSFHKRRRGIGVDHPELGKRRGAPEPAPCRPALLHEGPSHDGCRG